MESGVHGVESEADVCFGRRISGLSGHRSPSCGAGTGSADTLAGVADLTIPGEAPQSLPEGLLGHSTEHNQALASPARAYAAATDLTVAGAAAAAIAALR